MSSERNRVSPYRSREGSQAVRPDDSDAGKGGESKRMPLSNRADTDPVSGAKASPLLSGLSSRENMTNRHRDAKQMKAKQFAGAASAHNLAERQAVGRSAGDGESGQKDVRSGWRKLEYSGREDGCCQHVARSGVSTSPVAAYLYPKVKRQAASAGSPHDERPGHAGASSACARSGGGDHSGSGLLSGGTQMPEDCHLAPFVAL